MNDGHKVDLSELRIVREAQGGGAGSLRRRGRRRWILILLLSAMAVMGWWIWTKGWFTPAQDVQAITVSRLAPAQSLAVLNATGYVVAQRKVAVASKGTGRLAYLGVEAGQKVTQGEVIARLENDDLVAARDEAAARIRASQAQVELARAEIRDAGVNLQRLRGLLARKVVSQADFDTAETRWNKARAVESTALSNVELAQASLRVAQASLDYTLIRAPFDAVVLTKDADLGEVVAPFGSAASAKAAVATLADMESLMVEADVSEANIGKAQVGQPCQVTLDALPDRPQEGRVHVIMPIADRTKGTITVKVTFIDRDPRVRPEMSAKVAFLRRPLQKDERQPRLSVASDAVLKKGEDQMAWLVDGDRLRLVRIRTGSVLGETTEVLSGLTEGDRVVLKPPEDLVEGLKVKVAQ